MNEAAQSSPMWDDTKWYRYGFLAGAVFVVLNVITLFLTDAPPASDASAEKIIEFFADNSSGLKTGAILFGFSLIFGVWWLGSLWRAISTLEPSGPRLALIAVIGFVMAGSVLAVGQAVYVVPAIRPDTLGASSEFIFVLTNVLYSAMTALTAVHVLALAALVLWTKFLPVWMGYLALVSAAAAVVGVIGIGADAPVFNIFMIIGWMAWLLWTLLASILLYRSSAS